MNKIFICLLFQLLVDVGSREPNCDDDWEDGSKVDLGKLWFETSEKLTYSEAVTFCENRNSQLIEIDSPEQWAFVNNKLKSISSGDVEWTQWQWDKTLYYRGWWAGATDEAEEGTWVWTESGNPVGNFTWGDGQPDNSRGSENYFSLIIWRNWDSLDYQGQDVNGFIKLYPLCQQKR